MASNPQYSGLQPLRPPVVGSMDPTRPFAPPMPSQFRPVVPAPHSQQFIPMAPQHFQPLGPGVPLMNAVLPPPPQAQQSQFSQPLVQLPSRTTEPGHGTLPPQAVPLPVAPPGRPFASESPLPQSNAQPPTSYMSGLGAPLSSSYSFASSYGHPQNYNIPNPHPASQIQVPVPSSGGQPILPSEIQGTDPVMPLQQIGEQSFVTTGVAPAPNAQPITTGVTSADWREHTSADGRRYYYNKKTKISSWEKPLELMTPIERADASTNWKEFNSPDGRKYYYNKVTKESKWRIPEELKLAREQVEKASTNGTRLDAVPCEQKPSTTPSKAQADSDVTSSIAERVESSPVAAEPTIAASDPQMVSSSSISPAVALAIETNADEYWLPINLISLNGSASGSAGTAVAIVNTGAEPMDIKSSTGHCTDQSADDVPAEDVVEEIEKEVGGDKVKDTVSEERAIDQETLVYADKQEAKNAFKALLESANVGSDWTWDRAMRVIITDKRYGALKTLGERKQAFNEFLGQKKKQEVEERRLKHKRGREEFRKMLEEFTELTSSTRWSKAESIFENDERFKAIERDRDRRDLFENYVEELKNKERAKAQKDRKQNTLEYRNFLESCDFIKASSQWRKVQDRLEADERCSRLEKIDRLEIFQEYLRDLEKEEEEQRKIQKEELRKAERKNRDEFRKMIEEHISTRVITPKTHWRDYHAKVKDLPAYLAVASNSSGSTPKDLFEDVAEELQKQYRDDRTRIKYAVKMGKVTLSLNWTLEDFRAAISKDIDSPPVSDVNLGLVFDEFLERIREKDEKEARRNKRLADDFYHLIFSIKDISASSKWEECKLLFEGSQEYSSIVEERICREIFEEYITQLKEQEKENERIRKEEKAKKEKEREERERRKEKQRREKETGREREKDEHLKRDRTDSENDDVIDSSRDYRRSEREDNKKQRKHHHSPEDQTYEEDNGYDRSKKSQEHRDRKKSRRHATGHDSDSEGRHRRHRKERHNGSHRSSDHVELEDGEFGADRDSR